MRDELDRRLAAEGAKGHRAIVAGVLRGPEQHCRGWSAEGEARPDASSLFEIGSITKAFTGVLLADMVLRGEVALEDPLSRHLPSPRPAWRRREPTLLALATHRSGLPNVPGAMGRRELLYVAGLSRTDPWAGVTPGDYAALVERQRPRRGTRYSSMGVGLLGDALAARAGTSYEELLRERVLRPLGMTSTFVTGRPDGSPPVLQGHARGGDPRPPLADHMPAAGSLRSNAGDMLRFLAACLDPPADPPGPALALAREPRARLGRGIQIGLCWLVVGRPRAPSVVWHNGGTWGFRSFAGFAPDAGTAAVVLTNTSRGVDRLGLDLV